MKTPPGLIQVLSRDGNRRDAVLTCGLCDAAVQIHFYEPPGTPLLDGALLWVYHYGKCPGVVQDEEIGLRLMWDVPGRDTENLALNPKTRDLHRFA